MLLNHITSLTQAVPLNWYLYLSLTLFAIGVTGVLLKRNAIILLLCIEIMLNAANLLFVAFSAYNNDPEGQIFVFFVMVVAAAEVAVGLAIIVMIYRNLKSVNINLLDKLKW